jgi:hypothetical protein
MMRPVEHGLSHAALTVTTPVARALTRLLAFTFLIPHLERDEVTVGSVWETSVRSVRFRPAPPEKTPRLPIFPSPAFFTLHPPPFYPACVLHATVVRLCVHF